MRFAGRFGQRARRRLKLEKVIWLTSVDADGAPQPRPVWFDWGGRDLLVYSKPGAGKLRQIRRNPRVALHLNSTEDGDDVVVLLGEARIAGTPVPSARRERYLRKYRRGIRDLGMTPTSFLSDYSVAVYIRPTTLRGF
jgi:PPOX class probable F420-dependent enzyme